MPVLETDLAGAVRRGEVSAWFQPQVDLRSRRVVAAEALCRWRHPRLGDVSPDDFIPLAEDAGLIDELGVFMARQSCLAIEEWRIDMSVNVSPRQLVGSVFTTWLERQLSGVVMRDHTLTIEITEAHPIVDFPSVVRRLDELRGLGVGIAVDDFGSGQSSLKQARRLHATELKIDRALVVDDATTDLLVDAVERAHASGMRVVAEGVETEHQLDRVVRLGCDRAQGFLFGRPMPKRDFARALRVR